ncbi:MAG: type II toxin-antitoxin system ParD family antitoxin [Tepidisphaerales bacterium]
MQIVVTKPEVEKFIDEQVQSGNYASANEVVEAAVTRFMQDDSWNELDDDDMAAIAESEEQIRQGRVRPFKDAAEELRL